MTGERTRTGSDQAAATGPGTQEETAYRLAPDAEDITHFVCCRSDWGTAFCGIRDEKNINPAARIICTMCVEVAERMLPGCLSNGEPVCPMDKLPCPDEHEINLRIARETDPA